MQELKRQKGKREAESKSWNGLVWGTGLAALMTVFLLGVCAVLIAAAVVPERSADACVVLSCVVGTLTGGRMAVRGKGKGALPWGICVGALMVALLGVSGFLLYDGLEPQRCVAVAAACLCGGGVAGTLGRSSGRKRRT